MTNPVIEFARYSGTWIVTRTYGSQTVRASFKAKGDAIDYCDVLRGMKGPVSSPPLPKGCVHMSITYAQKR